MQINNCRRKGHKTNAKMATAWKATRRWLTRIGLRILILGIDILSAGVITLAYAIRACTMRKPNVRLTQDRPEPDEIPLAVLLIKGEDKDEEQYFLRYNDTPHGRSQAIHHLAGWARNDELSFDWDDAITLATEVGVGF